MPNTNFFVIRNSGEWADRKLLGLTPTVRAIFQARAAGARSVTIILQPGGGGQNLKGAPADVELSFIEVESPVQDLGRLADELSASVQGPILVVDSGVIFQRDFAVKALESTHNTIFATDDTQVAAFRVDDREFASKSVSDSASAIDTREKIRAAKKMLYQGLKKPLLVNGLVAAYIQRPIAHYLMLLIVNTPVRPNHVTVFAMLTGLAGAALLFIAGARTWMMQLGLLLYFMGSVFDCVDGDLARLKHQGSYLGSWLDTIADDSSTTAILLALGFYVAQMTGKIEWMAFGGGAALVFLLGETYIYYHLVKIYHSGDVLDFVWASGVKKRAKAESIVDYLMLFVKRDFFTLAVLVLGLFEVVHVGLVWLAVMMYLYGGYVLIDIILSLRRPGWRRHGSN